MLVFEGGFGGFDRFDDFECFERFDRCDRFGRFDRFDRLDRFDRFGHFEGRFDEFDGRKYDFLSLKRPNPTSAPILPTDLALYLSSKRCVSAIHCKAVALLSQNSTISSSHSSYSSSNSNFGRISLKQR